MRFVPLLVFPLNRLKPWFVEQVQDVPEDIAVCEFDCRKPVCLVSEWETCERRLRDLEEERQFRDEQVV
jgi:hypothetical protein